MSQSQRSIPNIKEEGKGWGCAWSSSPVIQAHLYWYEFQDWPQPIMNAAGHSRFALLYRAKALHGWPGSLRVQKGQVPCWGQCFSTGPQQAYSALYSALPAKSACMLLQQYV